MTSNRSTRRTARPSRALMLGAASLAGTAALVVGGYAQAVESAPSSQSPAAVSKGAAPAPDRPVGVEHEVGKVLEGTADAGTPVMVTLYENSLHGSSVQVVLGDPDEDNIGFVEQPDSFFQDGALDVTVDVNGTPVRFTGTAAPNGKPTKIGESFQDNGERIVTKGTNTPLATDISVTVGSVTAPVEFAPAFSFDLETRKVSLYGR